MSIMQWCIECHSQVIKVSRVTEMERELLNRRCLAVNQERALREIVGCTKTTLPRNLGKLLYSIR
jgi:hypothetical protein